MPASTPVKGLVHPLCNWNSPLPLNPFCNFVLLIFIFEIKPSLAHHSFPSNKFFISFFFSGLLFYFENFSLLLLPILVLKRTIHLPSLGVVIEEEVKLVNAKKKAREKRIYGWLLLVRKWFLLVFPSFPGNDTITSDLLPSLHSCTIKCKLADKMRQSKSKGSANNHPKEIREDMSPERTRNRRRNKNFSVKYVYKNSMFLQYE